MKVEIWSDVTCPYCYIGKRHFEMALSHLSFSSDIEVIWRSYELEPNAEKQYQQSKVEYMAEKYDQPIKWAELLCQSLTEQGAEVDILFNFDSNKVTNSYDAHRLLQFAKTLNKENELKEELFSACFTKGKLLADHQVLIDCSEKIGLSPSACLDVLSSEDYSEDVLSDKSMAKEIGIQSAPFFIINEAYGMEGAQPIEHIKSMLNDIHAGNI